MAADETVEFFEIEQPLCSLAYGVAPCTAALGVSGVRKCFNTRATCQDPANFKPTKIVSDVYAARFNGAAMGVRNANLAGIANTKSAILSAWVRFDAGCDDVLVTLLAGFWSGGTGLYFSKDPDNRLTIEDGVTYSLRSVNTYLAGSGLHHIWASWNGATGAKHLYVDGVSDLDPASFANNVNADYASCTNWIVSGSAYVDCLFGAIGEMYFAPGQYLDGAVAANRQKFRSAAGEAVSLGSTGATPTGVAPRVYLHLGYGQAGDDFLLNRGSGGAFVSAGDRLTVDDVMPPSPTMTTVAPNALTLRLSRAQDGLLREAPVALGLWLPSLQTIDTTPASINLAAMDESVSALGSREVVTVRVNDHLHSDLGVDPYRLQRISGAAQDDAIGYDPATRGTFWGKWIARNPYHQHLACRVIAGTLDADGAIEITATRRYVLDRIDGPTNGTVTLVAKDTFSLIEALKAVAPRASRGELQANISAVAGSATLLPAGIGALDYPASGHVAIGDELIAFTRAADVLTLTTRGAFNSAADTHDAQDLVQRVLSYVAQPAYLIVYDLLVNYSSIDPLLIDLAQWAIDAAELTGVYTARIVEPTPVADLIGELAAQAGFTVWPEVATGRIRFVPLRAQAPTATLDDDGWIVDASLSLKRAADKRVSQAMVYYGQINPVVKLDERRNYRSRVIVADLNAESEDEYGTSAIREIYSRWIPQFGRTAAQHIGNRVLTLFRDPPLEVKLSIHASREGAVALARYFALRTAEVQDDSGALLDTQFAAIEIERTSADEIEVRGQQVKFFAGGDVAGGDRVIYIENDVADLNLRAVHDSLYAVPLGGSPGEQVKFIVLAGVKVGASSTATRAIATGAWPAGVDLFLEIHGHVEGAGGAPGHGGDSTTAGVAAGAAGLAGGLALLATFAITISGDGRIAGGGGGGGGGGAARGSGGQRMSGGGGGGGAGNQAAPGAPAGGVSGGSLMVPGSPGNAASELLGGTPGPGGVISASFHAGNGGTGGNPGNAGSAGTAGDASGGGGGATAAGGGLGGAAGKSIQGIAFVTFAIGSTVVLVGATA